MSVSLWCYVFDYIIVRCIVANKLFGIQQIGTTLFLEDTYIVGPSGCDGGGVHTLLDHGADVAATYEFLEKSGEELVADTEVAVGVYKICQIDADRKSVGRERVC